MSFLKTIGNWFGFGGSDEQPPPSPTGTTRVEKSLLGARDHSPVKGLPKLISPLMITEEEYKRKSLRQQEQKLKEQKIKEQKRLPPPPPPTRTLNDEITPVKRPLLGARDHSPVKGLPNLISPLPITEEDHRRSLRLNELKEEFAKMNLNKQTGARSYSEANPDEESGNPRPRKRSRKDGRKRKSKKSKKSKKRKSNSRRRKRL